MNSLSFDEILIRTMHDDVVSSLNRHDVEKLLSLFTEDTILMEPHAPVIKGKTQIAQLLSRHKENKVALNLSYNIEELEIFGSRAFVRGRLVNTTFTDDLMPVHHIAKFISLSQKQDDGAWLRTHVMVNSDMPAQ